MTTYIIDEKLLRTAIQSAGLTADQFTAAVGISVEELCLGEVVKMTGAEKVRILKKIDKLLNISCPHSVLVEKGKKSLHN